MESLEGNMNLEDGDILASEAEVPFGTNSPKRTSLFWSCRKIVANSLLSPDGEVSGGPSEPDNGGKISADMKQKPKKSADQPDRQTLWKLTANWGTNWGTTWEVLVQRCKSCQREFFDRLSSIPWPVISVVSMSVVIFAVLFTSSTNILVVPIHNCILGTWKKLVAGAMIVSFALVTLCRIEREALGQGLQEAESNTEDVFVEERHLECIRGIFSSFSEDVEREIDRTVDDQSFFIRIFINRQVTKDQVKEVLAILETKLVECMRDQGSCETLVESVGRSKCFSDLASSAKSAGYSSALVRGLRRLSVALSQETELKVHGENVAKFFDALIRPVELSNAY